MASFLEKFLHTDSYILASSCLLVEEDIVLIVLANLVLIRCKELLYFFLFVVELRSS